MKLIPQNLAISATATSAKAAWPASNVVQLPVKKMWQAPSVSVATATVSVVASGQMDSIAIFGIAADDISTSISSPNQTEWEAGEAWEAGTEWEAGIALSPSEIVRVDLSDSTVDSDIRQTGAVWFEFSPFSGTAVFNIAVSSGGREITLAIGTVFIGTRNEDGQPRHGLTIALIDYSIERELANGAMYYKKRDVVREFQFDHLFTDNNKYLRFTAMIRKYGRQPIPWILVDNGGEEWLFMGRIKSASASLQPRDYKLATYTIREEI